MAIESNKDVNESETFLKAMGIAIAGLAVTGGAVKGVKAIGNKKALHNLEKKAAQSFKKAGMSDEAVGENVKKVRNYYKKGMPQEDIEHHMDNYIKNKDKVHNNVKESTKENVKNVKTVPIDDITNDTTKTSKKYETDAEYKARIENEAKDRARAKHEILNRYKASAEAKEAEAKYKANAEAKVKEALASLKNKEK